MINDQLLRKADQISGELAALLKEKNRQIVLAESCTGGLISAILTQYPGISNWLCGSAVVYQDATKREWLGLEASLIQEFTSVSRQVTENLALAALENTSGAQFALAITGHLEPGACVNGPEAFVAIAIRRPLQSKCIASVHHPLMADSRIDRQWQAACYALADALAALQMPGND